MARKESIIHQVFTKLDELKRFGESKHQAKQFEKIKCKVEEKQWNAARVPGIFSYKTVDTYKEHCLNFARWARSEHGCKTLDQAKPFVGQWLQQSIDKEHSAWTIRTKASAVAKMYGCKSNEFGVKLPSRNRENITRSRKERLHDKHFSEKKNINLVNFCKGTGLRRKEITALRAKDIYKNENGRVCVHVERGKGGRTREVPVVEKYVKHVWNCRQAALSRGYEAKVFEHIPNRADIHGYRREYASSRYNEVFAKRDPGDRFKELYNRQDGRTFDREVLKEVSKDMGHSRVDVIARHYLD
jgi:integrase